MPLHVPVEIPKDCFTLIEEQIVTGAAVGRVTFTDLDLNKHKNYKLTLEWDNPVSGEGHIWLFYNGDEVSSNYVSQHWRAAGSGESGNRADAPRIAFTGDLTSGMSVINIGISPGGYINAVGKGRVDQENIAVWLDSQIHNVVQENLTNFTLSWRNAIGFAENEGFGVGSKFRLYGYKAST